MTSPQSTLYLVVHGIGDPPLGETAQQFARGLTYPSHSIPFDEERHLVPEPNPDDPRTARAFPVPVLRDSGGRVVVAEVHWGDLSRFPVSLWGIVEGIFGVLFGLRYIAYQAATNVGGWQGRWLRWLSRWSTFVIVGPIASMNLLLLFFLGAASLVDYFWPASFGGERGVAAVQAACAAALLVGAVAAWRLWDNQVVRVVGVWLAASAAAVLAFTLYVADNPQRQDARWAIPLLVDLSQHLTDRNLPRGGIVLPSVYASVLLGVYFIALNVLLAVAAAVLIASRKLGEPERRSALTATLLPFVMMFGWVLLVPGTWVALGKVLPNSKAFADTYEELILYGVPRLPIMLIVLLVVLVHVLGVWVHWWYRARRLARTHNPAARDDGARLILAVAVHRSLLAMYFCLVGLFLFLYLHAFTGWPQIDSAAFAWVQGNLRRIGAPTIVILSGLAALLPVVLSQVLPYLRSGLDLAYDILNHFYFSFRDVKTGTMAFPVRAAEQHRLSAAVEHFSNALVGDCRLVIVSHSQGTVIAVDVLNDRRFAAAFGRFASVQLVTMGSPFSHVYQHYFRKDFPKLNDPHWQALAAALRPPRDEPAWVNVYRTDDYVGRWVDDSTGVVVNAPVPPRGHVGYWVDIKVLDVLRAERII